MIDWPKDPPLSPEQETLAKSLWEHLSKEEQELAAEAARAANHAVASRDPLHLYRLHTALLAANSPWRRALRLHYWRLRYLWYRSWAWFARPWESANHRRDVRAYIEYHRVSHAQDTAVDGREEQE